MTTDRTPAPVPPAALEAAAAAMEAAEEEHFSAEPGGWVIDRQTYTEQARVALEAAAPILLAAGRTAAAADIAEKLRAEADDEAQRPGRHQNCCSRAIETWLHEAAHIAEGTDHAG